MVLVSLLDTSVGVAGACIERLSFSAHECQVLQRGLFFVHHNFCMVTKSPARINGYRALALTFSKKVSIFSGGVLGRAYSAIMSNSFGSITHIALYSSSIYLRTTFPFRPGWRITATPPEGLPGLVCSSNPITCHGQLSICPGLSQFSKPIVVVGLL